MTELSAHAAVAIAPDLVVVNRDDLMRLVLAGDMLAEHHAAVLETTPSVLGTDTLLALDEAGIIDADTLDVSDAFRAALARTGQALRPAVPDTPAADFDDDDDDEDGDDDAGLGDEFADEPDLPRAGSFAPD